MKWQINYHGKEDMKFKDKPVEHIKFKNDKYDREKLAKTTLHNQFLEKPIESKSEANGVDKSLDETLIVEAEPAFELEPNLDCSSNGD